MTLYSKLKERDAKMPLHKVVLGRIDVSQVQFVVGRKATDDPYDTDYIDTPAYFRAKDGVTAEQALESAEREFDRLKG